MCLPSANQTIKHHVGALSPAPSPSGEEPRTEQVPSKHLLDSYLGSVLHRAQDAISVGMILRQFGVVTAALVERMAPDDLWALFQRVVPLAPVRPQGGGHRRRGDREVLAAIIFVATSGCTWNQLPPGFGLSGVTAFRRFTEWSQARCGPSSTAWSWTNLVPGASWTGPGARSTPPASGPSKGAADGTESDRPRQEGIENPPPRRPPGPAPVDRHLRRQPPRQPGPHSPGPRHPAHPLPSRPTAQAPREAAR